MNYNFEFLVDEVNLILMALGELPAKTSINLILKIKSLAESQENKLKNQETKNE